MSLLYPGNASFQQVSVPRYAFGGFDLDRMTVQYKGGQPDLVPFLASGIAAPWSASPLDAGMFLSAYNIDGDKPFPGVEFIYLGKKGGVLTAGQHLSDNAVLSASSVYALGLIFLLATPVVVQYYAPRNVLTWISRSPGALGPSGSVSDPTGELEIISVKWGELSFANRPDILTFFLDRFFTVLITSTTRSEEVVSGQYWRNQQVKTKVLIPFTSLPPTGDLFLSMSIKLLSGDGDLDFVELKDSGTGKVIGVHFNGSQWRAYTDVGAGVSVGLSPSAPVYGSTYHSVDIQLHPNGNGTWTGTFSFDGVSAPPLTASSMNIDTLLVGAINGSGSPNRNIQNAPKLGTSDGNADIFLGDILPPVYPASPVLVPPYTSVVALAVSDVNLGDLSIQLGPTHTVPAYASKTFTAFVLG